MAPRSTCFPLPNESRRPGVQGRDEGDDSVSSRGGGGACNVGPNEGTQRRQVGAAAVAMTRECRDPFFLSPFSFRPRCPARPSAGLGAPSASPAEASSGSALQPQPEAQPLCTPPLAETPSVGRGPPAARRAGEAGCPGWWAPARAPEAAGRPARRSSCLGPRGTPNLTRTSGFGRTVLPHPKLTCPVAAATPRQPKPGDGVGAAEGG